MRSESFIIVAIHIAAFWVMTPRSLVGGTNILEEHVIFYPKDGDNILL
jgi:hypothetical protein